MRKTNNPSGPKSMHNILIVLLGPTGIGKTDISVNIAGHFHSEIISCDSRQFYREMKIGTAVPSEEQLKRIPHHFIHFLSVNDYYSASLFERDVLNLLPELFIRNNILIMSGGSGMYIDAVCTGIDDIPDIEPAIREKYIRKYKEEGLESLRIGLKMVDPEYYSKVDLKNYKRIIRALEIFEATGRPFSSFLKKEHRERSFRPIKLGLSLSRDELYEKINQRVDRMINMGLEEEARTLFEIRHLNALNTVGYKELFEFFENKISREKAIELIKRNSRRYAKRQMTWWAKDKDIRWFHPEHEQDIIDYLDEVL
jgi:tRNA dimethylallyltransferase